MTTAEKKSAVKENKKFTTIQELENSGEFGEVWVINSTPPGTGRAQITFSVPKLNGDGSDPLYVPNTFLPIELTGQVTKRQLLMGGNFRRACNQKSLRLVTPEYARELLSEPGVEQEQEKLRKEAENNEFASVVPTQSYGQPEKSQAKSNKAKVGDEGGWDGDAEEEDDPTLGAIDGVIARLKAEELDEVEALNEIRAMGDLSKEHYMHISRNTKDYAAFTTYIKRIRQKFENDSDNDDQE